MCEVLFWEGFFCSVVDQNLWEENFFVWFCFLNNVYKIMVVNCFDDVNIWFVFYLLVEQFLSCLDVVILLGISIFEWIEFFELCVIQVIMIVIDVVIDVWFIEVFKWFCVMVDCWGWLFCFEYGN